MTERTDAARRRAARGYLEHEGLAPTLGGQHRVSAGVACDTSPRRGGASIAT